MLIEYIDKCYLKIFYCQIQNLDDFIYIHLLKKVDI